MAKRQIQFYDSMTENKRADSFAYLRRNILSTSSFGLYPARDFLEVTPTLSYDDDIIDILGTNDEQKIIVERSGGYDFYEVGRSGTQNTSYGGSDIIATALGNQEANPLFFVDEVDDKVFSVNFSNSSTPEVATFPSTAGVGIGGFDGLYYWWVGEKIWRQLGDDTPELMMSITGFRSSEIKFLAFYNSQMVLYTQQGDDTVVYFWDKKSSTFVLSRITYPKANVIGGAVIDGLPLLVKSSGVAGNQKEKIGEMSVLGYNGTDFIKLNSIRTGQTLLQVAPGGLNGASCRANEEYMVLSVDDNDNTDANEDLYQNYIYKIWKDGRIEVLTLPVENSVARNYANVVNIFSDKLVYSVMAIDTVPSKVYVQQDYYEDYDEYRDFTESTYITNFIANPYNYHKLSAVSVTFEKLFKGGGVDPAVPEQLDLYCRVSEREDWTLLGEITAQKVIDNVNLRLDPTTNDTTVPVREQRYQITKLPDGTSLPEFNEIQFKFHSKNGFSVIGAWFEYDYITRNTKR